MGFSSASRTQLTEVEVVLDKRQHTGKQQPTFAVIQLIRLIAAGAQNNLCPFLLCKCLAPLLQFLNVYMRHLDRRKLVNEDWGSVLILFHIFVFKLDNAPNAAAEQPIKLSRVILGDRDCLDSEVRKLSLISVRLNIEIHRDFINYGIAPALTEDRKNFLSLVRTDIVFSQNPFDVCNAGFNDILIIRAAILPEKKFKDIDRDVRTFLDFLCKIFANNSTVEYLTQFAVDYGVCILC